MLDNIDIQTHVLYPYQAPCPHNPLPWGLVCHLDSAPPQVGSDTKPEDGKHSTCSVSSKHLFRRMVGEVDAWKGNCCGTRQGEDSDCCSLEGRKVVATNDIYMSQVLELERNKPTGERPRGLCRSKRTPQTGRARMACRNLPHAFLYVWPGQHVQVQPTNNQPTNTTHVQV